MLKGCVELYSGLILQCALKSVTYLQLLCALLHLEVLDIISHEEIATSLR